MRRLVPIVVAAMALAQTFCVIADEEETKQPPTLECRKLVLEAATAVETGDLTAISRLSGEKLTPEEEAEFKKDYEEQKQSGELKKMLDRLRLFPEIGQIPSWVRNVEFECWYIEGNNVVKLKVGIEYQDELNSCVITALDADDIGSIDEEEKEQELALYSPAPPEGQKTLDAGLSALVAKFVAALKSNDMKALRECGGEFVDESDEELATEVKTLHEGADGKLIELLSQFPTIGAIPAPASRIEMAMSGTLDGKEVQVGFEFAWEDKKTVISDVDVDVRAPEQEEESEEE